MAREGERMYVALPDWLTAKLLFDALGALVGSLAVVHPLHRFPQGRLDGNN
jgi:hypothetical protein